VQRRAGEVFRLTGGGEGGINLTKLAEEFYRSARWLRVFACRPVRLSRERVMALVSRSRDEVREDLEEGRSLLA